MIVKDKSGKPLLWVLYDDSVLDRHRERVLVRGMNIEYFKKNPVALWLHNGWTFPIGKWVNIEAEGSRLIAHLDIDGEDELAMEVKGKIDRGYIKGASVGFRHIATSDDPALYLPGQRYKTITQSEIVEASIVPIPSNPLALAQKGFESFKRSFINLEGEYFDYQDSDQKEVPNPKGKNHITMTQFKNFITLLGLEGVPDDASEAQVIMAISQKIAPKESPPPNEEDDAQPSSGQKTIVPDEQVDVLIELGKLKGVVTEENEQIFRGIAKRNYSDAMDLLKVVPVKKAAPKQTLKGALNELEADSAKEENKPDGELTKDELSKMSKGQRVAYNLKKKHGFLPNKEGGSE